MHIESVELKGIAGFAEARRFDFSGGVTVVLGSNGSGKTALAWSIRAILSGIDDDDSGFLRRDQNDAFAELGFVVGHDRFRLRREFNEDRIVLENVTAGKTLLDGAPVDEQRVRSALEQLLGADYLRFWLVLGMRNQDGIGTMSPPVPGVDAVTGEDEALTALRDEYASLTGSGGEEGLVIPGQLSLVEEEIAEKEQALERWVEVSTRFHDELEKISAGEADWVEAERAAQAREEVYINLRRFFELTQEKGRLEESLQDLKTQRDTIRKHVDAVEIAEKKLEEEYGEFLSMGADLEDALQAWTDATTRLHDSQRRLHLARQGLSVLPNTNSSRNGAIAAVVLAVLGFLACLGADATGTAFILSPLLAVLGFGGIWAKDRGVEARRRTKYEEADALETDIAEAESMIAEAKKTMGGLGRKGHPMAIRRGVLQYWKAREEVEHLRTERDQFPSLHEVVDAHERILEELKGAEQERRGLLEKAGYLEGMDTSSRESLAGEVDMAKSQSEASRARADRLHEDFKRIRDAADYREIETASLGMLERELAEFREQCRLLELRAGALAVAIEELESAAEEHRAGHQARMAERAGSLFATFTRGRFRAVRFAQGRKLEVESVDGEWSEPSRLSRGVHDKLDLAVRMASALEMAGNHAWPLVLDEIFLHWDRTGLAGAEQAIRAYGQEGGQVLLLSLDEHFLEWGDRVIHLDRPWEEPAASRPLEAA